MLRAVAEQQLLSWYCEGKKGIKNNKLNLFGKGIVIIDVAKIEPQVMQSILELDLSHNSIRNVDNIDQFTNLQSINLSHNLIADLAQVDKLASLKRLRKISIKKNPFLKDKIPLNKLQFLMSLQTDVDIVGDDVESRINEIVRQMVQMSCYEDYRRRTMMHIQLIKEAKSEGSFINPAISMFPKIKKIFEQAYEKQITLRRVFVHGISKDCFQNEKKLILWLGNESERLKEAKSTLIKEIYEVEDRLKQLRLNFNPNNCQRLQEKKTANLQSLSKEGQKQPASKMNTAISALRRSKGRSENSPPRLATELKDAGSEKYLQQNFVNILTKTNPLYHLLHSPLSSLKNHEKEMLIQQLVASLKEKMKEAMRFQLLQKEHASMKDDFLSLQQHLEWMTVQVKKEQESTNKKLQKLQLESDEQQMKISALKVQLQHHKEVSRALKQENQSLKLTAAQSTGTRLRHQNEEVNSEAIETNREARIKSKYLKLLIKKSSHFAKLSLLRQINQKSSCNQWKQIVFEQFKVNRHLSLGYKHLMELQMRKNKKCLIHRLKISFQKESAYSLCHKYISHKHISYFFASLRVHFQNSSQLNHRIKVFRARASKRHKSKYFSIFRAVVAQAQQQNLKSQFNQFRERILLQRHYKLWLKYFEKSRQRYKSSFSLITHHRKAKALALLGEHSRAETNYYIHCEALQTFLLRYRKINSYLQFTKSLGSVLLQREIKGMKIKKMKQHTYFQYFLSTVRDLKVKNKIRQHERQLKREKEVRESAELRNQIVQKKRLLIQQLKKKILQISSMIRLKMIDRQNKIYFLHRQNLTRSSKNFIALLRSRHNLSIKLRHKAALLQKSGIFANPIRQFVHRLGLNRLYHKSAKAARRQKTVSLTFYRWKSFIFFNRMEAYKARFEQFQNELGEVVALQSKLKQQKQQLSGELLQKQMVIQQYIKKLQEYQYMLQSKDTKYQKLKAIYAEAMQLNDLNNTLKNHQNLILHERTKPREDNFYMKYLPPEVQKKIGTYDNGSLQGNTQSNQFNGLVEYEAITEETFRKGGKINNGGSFVSTFRRF